MPEISRFFGIIIRMYYNDHAPPHFHAAYQEFSADFDIFTLERINGNLPQRAQQLVLEWADLHRSELKEDWELARSFCELKKIEPLK